MDENICISTFVLELEDLELFDDVLIGKLRQLKREGYKIVFVTRTCFDGVEEALQWLNKHNLTYLIDNIVLEEKSEAGLRIIGSDDILLEAFLLGIETREDWQDFVNSPIFTQSVRSWINRKQGKRDLFLAL